MPLVVVVVLALSAWALAAFLSYLYPSPMTESTAALAARDTVRAGVAHHRNLRALLRRRVDPAAATGLALTIALAAVVAGGVVVGLLAYLSRASERLADVDRTAGQWGVDEATGWSTRGLGWITDLGDSRYCLAVVVALSVLEFARRRRNLWVPAFLAAVWLGSVVGVNAVKELLDRVRPTFNPMAETLGPSFPSGHSSMAAAFWAAVALVLARGRGRDVRILLSGAAVAIAVAVAGSRVLLGVHWFSDVVAGVAFGWAWFAVCSIAFGGRLIRLGVPLEGATASAGRSGHQRQTS